jgi:hypothetical protein
MGDINVNKHLKKKEQPDQFCLVLADRWSLYVADPSNLNLLYNIYDLQTLVWNFCLLVNNSTRKLSFQLQRNPSIECWFNGAGALARRGKKRRAYQPQTCYCFIAPHWILSKISDVSVTKSEPWIYIYIYASLTSCRYRAVQCCACLPEL